MYGRFAFKVVETFWSSLNFFIVVNIFQPRRTGAGRVWTSGRAGRASPTTCGSRSASTPSSRTGTKVSGSFSCYLCFYYIFIILLLLFLLFLLRIQLGERGNLYWWFLTACLVNKIFRLCIKKYCKKCKMYTVKTVENFRYI